MSKTMCLHRIAILQRIRHRHVVMGRYARSDECGAIATETAFLIPVVLVGIMMFMELARIMLTISIGSTAMDAAIQSLRREDRLDVDSVKTLVAERMADRRYSYGYLDPDDIRIEVEHFDSLEALGGGQSVDDRAASGSAQGEDDDAIRASQSRPVWSITVDVRKQYITPLPTFLTLEDAFRYRFKQVLGHLDETEGQESGA
ncbi:TadE/TadG family type IV pilus assembly protein [Corticimicrobacter populi]|nr:hypothetical protein [Corticimicrobacter populi]